MTDELTQAVAEHVAEDEVVHICRDLVRANSENPPGDERIVAGVVEAWLARLGLSSSRVEPQPGRISVLSEWGDAAAGPTLCFNGHIDVVPAGDEAEWPHPPFGAVVNDGKLYGRGSSDMKAGVAACLAAVAGLQRAGVEPKGRLVMQFVADEEALGVHGARYLVENGYCAGIDEAVVGEPTSLHLVTSERGVLWFRIHTYGRSAHGSTPRLGVNAIEHMARVVDEIGKIRFRKLHETLGQPTINIGTIAGGSKVNMVADHAAIEIDRRTLPGEGREEILADFEAVLERLSGEVEDFHGEIDVIDDAEAAETPEGTRMVQLLANARAAMGAEGSELGYMGATDARYLLNQGRIPTVIFGPGDIMLAHTTGEYVDVPQLVTGARIYAHAFARFLGAG